MPKSKRTTAKNSSMRYQTLATLNIPAVSGEMLLVWRSKITAGILVLLACAALYEFFMDDWFFISDIQTAGLTVLTAQEVERASGIQSYNVFFAEQSQIERAVRKLPEVKSVSAMIGLPNKIFIQLEERVPEYVWLIGEQAFWIDADAIAFPARTPRNDLVVVRDLSPTIAQAGRRVNPPAFNAVRSLHSAWQDSPKNFEWTLSSGLATTDEHGWKIYFGDASDMELKVTRLKALVPRLMAQNAKIKFIDLGKGDAYFQ